MGGVGKEEPMSRDPIYGYLFKIVVQKAEVSYVAYCPGIGGVFEEGNSPEDAAESAYKAACALLDARARNGHWLVRETKDLKIFRKLPNSVAVQELSGTPDEYVFTVPCSASEEDLILA